jgi:hypothetical protein
MVGVKLRSGVTVDGFTSILCAPTSSIHNVSTVPREVVANWGGGGGVPQLYQCPTGHALVGYTTYSGDWMDGVKWTCQSVTNPSKKLLSDSPVYGNTHPNENVRACPPNHFLQGLRGRAGHRMDSLVGQCVDATPYIETFSNPQRQLECCARLNTDPFACGQWTTAVPAALGGGGKCQETKRLCSQREYFFTPACKELFTGPAGRQVMNQTDNDVAARVCAEIKADPQATDDEKNWCACFNADVPPRIPLVARGLFQCVDPQCTGRGLKPFGMKCPENIVLCNQEDFTTALKDSEIGRQFIQQECGNIDLTDEPSIPAGPAGPSAPGRPTGSLDGSVPVLWVILGLGGVILLALLGMVGYLLRR